MKRFVFLFSCLFVFMGIGCKKNIENTVNQTLGIDTVNIEKQAQKDIALAKAKELFATQANQIDISKGPCLSEEIVADWSVDIVNSPRTAADNEPKNQCQNIINGKTHHFVELDMNGNVTRIK